MTLFLGAVALVSVATSQLGATVKFSARLFDGEESTRVVLDAMQQNQTYKPELKVPIAQSEVTVDLIDVPAGDGKGSTLATQSWKATTDAEGAFEVDTGLASLPARGFFVARVLRGGVPFYSPYVRPGTTGPVELQVYPTTDNPADIQARLHVAYDIQGSGSARALRVRCKLELTNRGGTLYVGRKAGGQHREIWRLPVPPGATILVNRGPTPDLPAWRLTADERALVLDTPVSGIFELSKEGWEVHYSVPAQQIFVQSYPMAIGMEAQDLAFWCPQDSLSIDSSRLMGQQAGLPRDPFGGEGTQMAVKFSTESIAAGTQVPIVVKADNVALGQLISIGPARWVGGFVLLCVLAILLGLVFGPRGPTAEVLLESLSGEEILDRIAQLDLRRQRGAMAEGEYARARESLVALAAEELAGATGESSPPRGAPALAPGVTQILRRIDELDRAGVFEPQQIAERMQLLEALARALPRGEAARA